MRIEDTKTNANTYYYYTHNPGSATVRVHVLGDVRLPGVYEISESTDLGQLIALSGGPQINANSRNTKQDISLRVYRPGANGQQIIFEESFEHSLANPQVYPILRDGDVFVMDVTQRQRFGWRDATSIVSTLGVLALAIDRLTRASR
jgi:protein involved in polysaccharide export with SLBB domain